MSVYRVQTAPTSLYHDNHRVNAVLEVLPVTLASGNAPPASLISTPTRSAVTALFVHLRTIVSINCHTQERERGRERGRERERERERKRGGGTRGKKKHFLLSLNRENKNNNVL